jgi:S1 RNA binding domain protein
MQTADLTVLGKIFEGKVVGVQNFGAFVEVSEPHFSGMVHISEIANRFVSDIKEFVKEGDIVKVKVLTVGDSGKISLSMKQAAETNETTPPPPERRPRKPQNIPAKKENTFDDMLAAFKRSSEEKMGELKRQGDRKNGRR